MFTLHAYILRELLKVFALAMIVLTAIFTMAGGVYNILKFESLSLGDVAFAAPFALPIVVTLVIIPSSLFAAVMVYGRLAADNELQACRAAGINIHRLLLSVVMLSLFVTGFTLLFGNYVIPGLIRTLERYARTNYRDFVLSQLQSKGQVHYGTTFFMTAESAEAPSESDLGQWGVPREGFSYLLAKSATCLQLTTDGRPVRFVTARFGLCQFDTRTSPVQVTLKVNDAHDYQIGKSVAIVSNQDVGPVELPIPIAEKASWADLTTLLDWRTSPWKFIKLADKLRAFRLDVGKFEFVSSAIETIGAQKPLLIEDPDGTRCEIRADSAVRDGKSLALRNPKIELIRSDGRQTGYQAGRGQLSLRSTPPAQLTIEIRLEQTPEQNVKEFHTRGGTRRASEKGTINLDPLLTALPAHAAALTDAQIADPTAPLALDADATTARTALQREIAEFSRKVVSLIHFRLGACCSSIVALVMGAALGIIFRGSNGLLAFVLSCVPAVLMFLVIMLGHQLAEHERTATIGPFVIWGGLAVMAAGDAIILMIGVRR